jgi:hypothetical protein
MYLQKVISRKTFLTYFFVGVLQINYEKNVPDPDPDPDPHQNVMYLQHWISFKLTLKISTTQCPFGFRN